MYHIHKYGSLRKGFPQPLLSFVADTGTSGVGTDMIQWDEEFGNGEFVTFNNNRPNVAASQGGLSPTINFVPNLGSEERMHSNAGTTAPLIFDDNPNGRGEGSLVFYYNHNVATNQILFSSVGAVTARRSQVRPRNPTGSFQYATTINDGVSFQLLRCAAAPTGSAVLVIITRELDGTTAIYFDGVAQTITTNTLVAGQFIPDIGSIAIGDLLVTTAPTFQDTSFDGQVSAFQLYEKALTQNQVTELTTNLQNRF